MLSLPDFLSEAVASRHENRFPTELYQDEFIYWLDHNGFRSLGVWDNNNASIANTTKGLRYLIGPGRDQSEKWLVVKGDGKTSVTIRFGEKRPGRHYDSEVNIFPNAPKVVRFAELEGILKTIIEESK